MSYRKLITGVALLALAASALWAQTPPAQVRIYDHGVQSSVAGPGAPAHVIGLTRLSHDITLNTGKVAYGLRYTVAKDPKDPAAAIPGEGYVGMSKPVDANWYGGGFFDLKLNGETIGNRMVQVFAGRAMGDRGYVDYVFDTPQAIVRLRFVGLADSEGLYTQVLVEPKIELKQISLALRCYPAGFVTGPSRQVLTPTRDLLSGARESLNLEQEWWLNYFDITRGLGDPVNGPCSVLWVPSQMQGAMVNVGGYSVDTALQLKPSLRDFRFIFFDHTGRKNTDVQAELKERAPQLLQELATLDFADASVLNWSLAEKLAETRQLLAALPEGSKQLPRYEQWGRELEAQIKQLQNSGQAGGIMAEAKALKTIMDWDQSLPELRLKALLNSF
jgi:hypothetical protein